MDGLLNPAQERVLSLLRGGPRPPPVEGDLRARLGAHLEAELGDLAPSLDGPAVVGKTALARVLACEAHHQAEAGVDFAWSIPTARGTVAHRAIELSIHRRDRPPPLVLVDDALTRLSDQPGDLADFLLGLDEAARAELRSQVNDAVAKFVELWPPLSPAWRPRTESTTRAELCAGKVQLWGRVDLALGTASGSVPGALLAELKTGSPHAGHLDDLRFYALVETLRVGVPPFRLAGYYLDAGTLDVEDVDEDVLEAALRRTVAGVRKVVELRLGLRSATVTANARCRWCVARPGCPDGQSWLEGTPHHDLAES